MRIAALVNLMRSSSIERIPTESRTNSPLDAGHHDFVLPASLLLGTQHLLRTYSHQADPKGRSKQWHRSFGIIRRRDHAAIYVEALPFDVSRPCHRVDEGDRRRKESSIG